MRRNQERRLALVDAAIAVLASDGARGLTFRAVDAYADVPNGTASNYFASRDDLLYQAGRQVHNRLEPTDAELAEAHEEKPSRELIVNQLRALVQRISTDRTGYLALLELRLEATRRPALRQALTETVRANLDRDIEYHRGSGAPGDTMTVILCYLAVNAFVIEQLTLPEMLSPLEPDELIESLIARVVPADGASNRVVRPLGEAAGH